MSRRTARSPDILAWRIGAIVALGLVAVLVVLDRIDHRPLYSQLIVIRTSVSDGADLRRQLDQISRIASRLPAEPGVRATASFGPNTERSEPALNVIATADDPEALRRFADDVAVRGQREFISYMSAVRTYHARDLLLIPLFVGMLLSVSTLQMGARRSEDSPTFTGGAIIVHLVALGLAAGAYALYSPDSLARIPMALFALVIVASEVLWAFQLPDMSDDRDAKSLRRPQLVAIACFAALALVRFVQPVSG